MSLPAGWALCELADVASFINGDRGKNYPAKAARVSHGVPFINAGHLAFGRVDMREMDFISRERFELLGSGKVQPGDLLFCLRGSLGKAALVTANEGAIASSLVILRPIGAATPEYLLAYLQCPLAASMVARYDNGTAQPNLSSRNVERFLLPLAPASEQARIVDALDSLLTRIDAAVASLESAQRKLKAYRASVLKAAVEGRLVPTEAELALKEGRSYKPANVLVERIWKERRRRWEDAELVKMKAAGRAPKDDRWKDKYEQPVSPNTADLAGLPDGWSWTTVGQLGEVTGGLTKNAARDSGPRRYPYLRVANVYANRLDLREVKEIAVEDSELPRLLLRRGDLLVVEGNGSVDQIGRVALWDGSIDPVVHQNHVIKVRFSRSPLERWVLTWLLSPGGRAAIERVASSTSGLHTLSISKVQSLPVPLPPANEQVRILETVDQLLSIVDANASSLGAGLLRCSRLRQSVLRWAFEGTLVEQDPNDEPAELLLARVRAERAVATLGQPKAKRSRKLRAAS